MTLRIATDPYITSTDSAVDRAEMLNRHDPPDAMSGIDTTMIIQDSGLDVDHPEIQAQTNDIAFQDFTGEGEGDAVGHGTMVTDLATRYATGADVVVNRVFGDSGSGGLQPFLDSFEWINEHAAALRPAVLVMSWGARSRVPAIDQRVNEIARKGIVPFAAAGNSGGATGSPATARYAVSVGALQEQGERMTNFSSWDQDSNPDPGLPGVPEVCAIGKNVIGARAEGTSMGQIVDDEHVKASGTSFSNPFVAGVGADVLSRLDVPDGFDAREMVLALEKAAQDIPGTARDGLGRVHWERTVDGEGELPPPSVAATVYDLPVVGGDLIHLQEDQLEGGRYRVDLEALEQAFTRE